MAEFHKAYEEWLRKQAKERKGEARRRLEEGHGQAERAFVENVWWPAVGSLAGLEAEFEIRDYKDGVRYLDFAYRLGSMRVCLEVDGFGPHWRDINRRQFADQWVRQNHLVLDGWTVLRFAYDDVMDRPRQCQQMILQLLGLAVGEAAGRRKVTVEGSDDSRRLTLLEQEILRHMGRQAETAITPGDVVREFGVCRMTSYRTLKRLVRKELIQALDPQRKRVHKYRLIR